MGVLTVVLLWHSKRKYLAIPVFLVGAFFAIQHLPDEWFGRMGTIETFDEDASALGRIEAWQDGWDHTLSRPFLGTGFEGWRAITRRDWHNSSVEMLSEHGFIAFGLWFSLIFGTILSLSRLPRKVKGVQGLEWVANYSYMLRASLIAYFVGTSFLGLSYWDILYHLIFISVLVRKFAMQELSKYMEENAIPSRRGKNMPLRRVSPVSRDAY
jgi:probable O-glycosylation ligase (exosortase A-associated)